MNKKIILLVEDNPTDEFLAKRALMKIQADYKVEVAHDGVEALDYLFDQEGTSSRNERDLPEIILLDLKLPRINGLEVLKEIRSREKTRNLPVLVLTSSSEEGDIDACFQMGANSFTIKPINSSRYMESVQELVHTWLSTSEGNGTQA